MAHIGEPWTLWVNVLVCGEALPRWGLPRLGMVVQGLYRAYIGVR